MVVDVGQPADWVKINVKRTVSLFSGHYTWLVSNFLSFFGIKLESCLLLR